ncbi:hypothetical protein IGB00_13185, partial [Pseudomonas aeruginosa]|nr:hypothetical protein [Pseudomonas aeruginosa]
MALEFPAPLRYVLRLPLAGASGAAEPDWRGYTSDQQQRSVLAVEQDAEAI